jgi:CTP:molybdopterin cytidylyltransferase MocA
VQGLLLAAGAGRRYGGPKALVPGWLAGAVDVLRAGGCDAVTVVLGAGADEVTVPDGVRRVVAADWAEGMGASLRTGLAALDDTDADTDAVATVVPLVDLTDVTGAVVARLLLDGVHAGAMRLATYAGVPGHPVLLGRDHWAGVRAAAVGDRGARDYLRAHPPELVECGDLSTGVDVDRPTGDQPDAE